MDLANSKNRLFLAGILTTKTKRQLPLCIHGQLDVPVGGPCLAMPNLVIPLESRWTHECWSSLDKGNNNNSLAEWKELLTLHGATMSS